jgi:membrane protein implicated in regulation of membrane protease activity
MRYVKKIIPLAICAAVIIYIFVATPYPNSWQEAPTWQILVIFIPLLIFLTLICDLFFKFWPKSLILAFGFWLIILFQALNVLTPLLIVAVLALATLLTRLYPKHKLTLRTKIPKLQKIGGRKK